MRDAITRLLDQAADRVAACLPVRSGRDDQDRRAAAPQLDPAGCRRVVGRHQVVLKKWAEPRRRERSVENLADFVEAFRICELRSVLGWLVAGSTRFDVDLVSASEPESVAAVAHAVRTVNRSAAEGRRYDDRLCRLLATGELVRAAERWNVVEDAVDVGTGLPSGIDGMVIPTVEGPVVDRIGDLSVQINRPVDGRIRISLIQRFVLNGTDTVVRLVRRRTPPGGCSCAG